VFDGGDPGKAQPDEGEIEYLLRSARRLFPAVAIGREDIQYAMAGVRPLPFAPGDALSSIARRHVLHDHASDGAAGMISLVGGKLTTAASVARECARKIGIEVGEPQVDAVVRDGEIESALQAYIAQVAAAGLSAESARAVVAWFGRDAMEIARGERLRIPICDGSPHMVGEAVYALRHECAVTLGDVLLRRAPVALAGWWSEECTRQAAERIGAAIGWSEERVGVEIEEFEKEREQFLVKVKQPVSV
jgi:glycerol-3-phosphate dehydrogenase